MRKDIGRLLRLGRWSQLMTINITLPAPSYSLKFGEFRSAYERLNEQGGVYFLYDVNGNLLYVGKSVNLYSRINQHLTGQGKSVQFAKFVSRIDVIFVSDDYEREIYETYAINMLKPSYNISKQYRKSFTDEQYEAHSQVNELRTEREFLRTEIYRIAGELGDKVIYDLEDDMEDEEVEEWSELEGLRKEYRLINEKITDLQKKLFKSS